MRRETDRTVRLGFAAIGLLILGSAWLAYRGIAEQRYKAAWVAHTLEVRGEVGQLSSAVLGAQSALRGYALVHEPFYLRQHEKALTRAAELIERARALTADNPSQQIRVQRLSDAVARKFEIWRDAKDAMAAGRELEFLRPDSDRELEGAFSDLLTEEDRLLLERTRASDRTGESEYVLLGAVFALAFALVMIGMVVVTRELRLRLASQRSFEAASRRFERLIDASPLPIFVTNTKGEVQLWNVACRDTFGWTREEVLGEFLPLVPEAARASSRALVERIVFGGERLETELVRQRRDGSPITVSVSAIPLLDGNGEPEGMMAILADVTDRVQAQAAMREAKDTAQRLSEIKSEFLANTSHELRTPLNGIIGMADLLIDTPLDAQQLKYARVLRDSGNALLSLINDLLDFSKVEAGKMRLEELGFDLTTVVESQIDVFLARAREKKLSLLTFVDPAIPARLKGDPGRIGQILLNFVGNAVKFTEHGSVVVRAELEGRENGFCRLRCSVADTGIGISPEAAQRLFNPFVQADGSTARRFGGTGLGLAISKRLVELMGGQVGVHSVVGEGSTFWFTLSLAADEVAETCRIGDRELDRLPVLVVDLDPPSGQFVSKYLASWQMVPETVPGCAPALAELESAKAAGRPYGLVVVDRGASWEEVTAFAERARGIAGARVPLLLSTDYDRGGLAEAAQASGFSACVAKPVKQSELYDAIMTAIREAESGAGPPTRAPSAAGSPESAPAEPVAAPTHRILVAEDNSVNQFLIMTLLKKCGYAAQAVGNGREALEAVTRGGGYDLVLMDCQMPEMDGYDATRAIREWEKGHSKRLPIIALTAHAMAEDERKCLECGMDGYLTKPVKRDTLAETLARWLRQKAAA